MSTLEPRIGAASRLKLSGRARGVSFGDDTLVIDLEDGRQLAVPIAWFPRLVAADVSARSNWELIGRGIGISWPDIDEDISVTNLLGADGELLMYREPRDLMAALKTSLEAAKQTKRTPPTSTEEITAATPQEREGTADRPEVSGSERPR